MLNRDCSDTSSRAPTGLEQDLAAAFAGTVPADFSSLSGAEIERLIAFCRTPALLWRLDPARARPPEPFGMIA